MHTLQYIYAVEIRKRQQSFSPEMLASAIKNDGLIQHKADYLI